MRNYYQTPEEIFWPERAITRFEEVRNVFDARGMAVKAFLECGHACVLTGDAIYNRTSIHCKPCADAALREKGRPCDE